jgi:hypothetical protein
MAKSDPKNSLIRPGITPNLFASFGGPQVSQKPGVQSTQSQPFVPQMGGGIAGVPMNTPDGRNLPRKMGSIGV